jgi:DNA primase small subunit
MGKREFAFFLFKEQIMLRHKGFENQDKLADFLGNVTPSDIYYSCAYYADPEADMDRKGWLGADLLFDIDADHIYTPCNKVHDKWTCGKCGLTGTGNAPQNCPDCGGQKFTVKTWPCEVCLESAKKETLKLLEMLTSDFGFSESEIHIFFSGHRGYHVHIESEVVRSLDTSSRKEIVDYVSGLGINICSYGIDRKNQKKLQHLMDPSLARFAWNKRLAQGMQDFILNATEEEFREVGLNEKVVTTLLGNKDLMLKNLAEKKTWSAVKGVGFESWKRMVEHSIWLQSAQIDTVVTTDVHRLIRMAGTLHSKTGLKKVEFPASDIYGFDPFKKAVAFRGGKATVFVYDAPEFRLGDEMFGPYKDQRVELPTAAVVLLICKGRAEVAN